MFYDYLKSRERSEGKSLRTVIRTLRSALVLCGSNAKTDSRCYHNTKIFKCSLWSPVVFHLKISEKAGLYDHILLHANAPVPRETLLSSAMQWNAELFVCHLLIKQPVFLEISLTKNAAPQLVRNQKLSAAGSCPEGKVELAFLI